MQTDFPDARRQTDGLERLVGLAIERAGGGLEQATGLNPESLLGLGGFAGLEHARTGAKRIRPACSTSC